MILDIKAFCWHIACCAEFGPSIPDFGLMHMAVGGEMKKDYQILLVFLGIIAVSGIVIFMTMSPGGKHPAQDQGQGVFTQEEEPQMPAGPDTTATRITIANLESRLKGAPNDLEILIGLGNSYYDMANPPMAIQYYERALKIMPNNPGVIVDLGAMYRQNSEPDKAIDMFRKAIELDPQLPQAYFNLGMVLRMEKNDVKGAAQAWEKYLKLDPNSQAKEFLQGEIAKAEIE